MTASTFLWDRLDHPRLPVSGCGVHAELEIARADSRVDVRYGTTNKRQFGAVGFGQTRSVGPKQSQPFVFVSGRLLSAPEDPMELPGGMLLTASEEFVGPQYERRVRFTIDEHGEECGWARIDTPWGYVDSHRLRRRLKATLSDERTVDLRRNGPRPASVLRHVEIIGHDLHWLSQAEVFGTHIRNLGSGAFVVRSRRTWHAMDLSLPGPELALALP